jgi:hypothetical protein
MRMTCHFDGLLAITAVVVVLLAFAGSIQAQCLPPEILSHPQSQTVRIASDAMFSVVVTGTEPLSYQWQKDAVGIPGATDPSFWIFDVAPSDAGDYRVISSNVCGTALSDTASLTVVPEPSSFALLGIGFVGLIAYAYGRRRRARG